MNRYKTRTPRRAVGLASIAMSALTLGVAVVLPAMTTAEGREPRIVESSCPALPGSGRMPEMTAVPSQPKQSTQTPHASLHPTPKRS